MIRTMAAAGCLAVLAACTPGGGASDTNLDPALKGDLTLTGTEPFWSLVITEATKSTAFTRPDAAPVSAPLPERHATLDGANLTAKAPDGDIRIALKKASCSDGMSDRKFPYEAVVNWQGNDFKGCAAPTNAMPAQPT